MNRTGELIDAADGEKPERQWYRHTETGQAGWIVERAGEKMIRLDRGGEDEDNLQKFNKDRWRPDVEKRPIMRGQLGLICFAADRELCAVIGLPEERKKTWDQLTDAQRLAWTTGQGPGSPKIRAQLYERIWSLFEKYSR